MIELPRNHHANAPEPRVQILGLGGAGANALDRIQLDGVEGAELIAINTDLQSLTGSVAPVKVQLGMKTTRGLGAGGDPELGYQAAEEAADELRAAMDGADMIFLCVGLGGGTGSGAAPLVASYAREQNALVVVFATLPFSFEGRRRMAQAEEALATLRHYADVVICFENDKMGDAVSPRAAIQEAFTAADQTISQSVRAVAALVRRRGLIHVGLDELTTALRRQNSRCIFGSGEAEGGNRAHAALELALKSPLMDRGRLLADAENVLVHIAGGPNLTLNEVQILMEEFNRHIGAHTRILFGTAIDPRLGNRLTVTILSSVEAAAAAAPAPAISVPRVERPPAMPARESAPALASEDEHVPQISYVETDDEIAVPAAIAPPVPMRTPFPARAPVVPAAADAAAAKRAGKQEQMQFEPVTRGRFEKSEPTIVDGQDLDVPTFLRRNIRPR